MIKTCISKMGARVACALVIGVVGASPASAQSRTGSRDCGDVPSVPGLFSETIRDVRGMSSASSLGIMAIGGAAALAARPVDGDVARNFLGQSSTNSAFAPGAVIGGTPFQLGVAATTYAIGRALHKPCAASLGADLIQAQLLAEGLTMGLKEVTRRSRPEGTGFSFPSGHTTSAFASATVLQRHFGWRVGVPAYAAAAYVAASRIEMNRHYLSDVAFGAALGIVAGRTVTVGHGHRLLVTPFASPETAGAQFTWIGRK